MAAKRLMNKVIDGGLRISYPPFEPDDFSQSLCPQLAVLSTSAHQDTPNLIHTPRPHNSPKFLALPDQD
jgi:hypothetical protein